MSIAKFASCTKLSKFFNEEHERRNMVFSWLSGPNDELAPTDLIIPETADTGPFTELIGRHFPDCKVTTMPLAEFNGDLHTKEGDRWLVLAYKMDGGEVVESRWLMGHYSVEEANFLRSKGDNGRFSCWMPMTGEVTKKPDQFADEVFSPEELVRLGIAPGTMLANQISVGPNKPDPFMEWVLSGPDQDALDKAAGIEQAEIILAQTLQQYDKDSVFVVMAEQRLAKLRGY